MLDSLPYSLSNQCLEHRTCKELLLWSSKGRRKIYLGVHVGVFFKLLELLMQNGIEKVEASKTIICHQEVQPWGLICKNWRFRKMSWINMASQTALLEEETVMIASVTAIILKLIVFSFLENKQEEKYELWSVCFGLLFISHANIFFWSYHLVFALKTSFPTVNLNSKTSGSSF